jgi:hypothetical protein
MEQLSRRKFISQGVAAGLATASPLHLIAFPLDSSLNDGLQNISNHARDLFANQGWEVCGRLTADYRGGALRLQDGFILSSDIAPQSCSFSFEGRAPEDASEVQVWAAIRCRDRDSRYLLGIRGGANNDVYLAKYAPEGGNRFLGVARLPFRPEVGYLKRPEQMTEFGGSPLLQIQLGQGTLIASEMELGGEDPIAKRLLGNLLRLLQTPLSTIQR